MKSVDAQKVYGFTMLGLVKHAVEIRLKLIPCLFIVLCVRVACILVAHLDVCVCICVCVSTDNIVQHKIRENIEHFRIRQNRLASSFQLLVFYLAMLF